MGTTTRLEQEQAIEKARSAIAAVSYDEAKHTHDVAMGLLQGGRTSGTMQGVTDTLLGATDEQAILKNNEAIASQYAMRAQELGIGTDLSDIGFVVMDGAKVNAVRSQSPNVYSLNTDNKELSERLSQMGKYHSNNSVTAFVNDLGQLCVCARSRENISKLEALGYTPDSMHVPMSNGENFGDSALNEYWMSLLGVSPRAKISQQALVSA